MFDRKWHASWQGRDRCCTGRQLEPRVARCISAHHRLEDNFETAGLRCQVEQPGTANSKKAAHRIVQASQWIGEGGTCSGHDPPPDGPTGCGSACYISAPNYQICSVRK